MHKPLLASIFCVAALSPYVLRAQVQNEDSRIEKTTTPEVFKLTWQSQLGRTYFIQSSDEQLANWNYLQEIVPGTGARIEYGFTANVQRFFFRLIYTDQVASNVLTADFDNDGVSNWEELQQGTDPFVPLGPRLAITWPMENAVIPSPTVDVIGTWGAMNSLRSLTLNGKPVYISGNSWSASAVPLSNGTNALTLTSTDSKGVVTTLVRTITASYATNAPRPVVLTANTTEGATPLAVTFTPQLNVTGTIQSVVYYYESRAMPSPPVTSLDQTVHTYENTGIYYPVVTVKLTDGSVYSSGGQFTPVTDRLTIKAGTIADSPAAAWAAFSSAIIQQDIEATSNLLALPKRQAWLEQLTKIGPAESNSLVTDLANIEEAVTLHEVSQYTATVSTPLGTLTFPINFIKEDGEWKIDEF